MGGAVVEALAVGEVEEADEEPGALGKSPAASWATRSWPRVGACSPASSPEAFVGGGGRVVRVRALPPSSATLIVWEDSALSR